MFGIKWKVLVCGTVEPKRLADWSSLNYVTGVKVRVTVLTPTSLTNGVYKLSLYLTLYTTNMDDFRPNLPHLHILFGFTIVTTWSHQYTETGENKSPYYSSSFPKERNQKHPKRRQLWFYCGIWSTTTTVKDLNSSTTNPKWHQPFAIFPVATRLKYIRKESKCSETVLRDKMQTSVVPCIFFSAVEVVSSLDLSSLRCPTLI